MCVIMHDRYDTLEDQSLKDSPYRRLDYTTVPIPERGISDYYNETLRVPVFTNPELVELVIIHYNTPFPPSTVIFTIDFGINFHSPRHQNHTKLADTEHKKERYLRAD